MQFPFPLLPFFSLLFIEQSTCSRLLDDFRFALFALYRSSVKSETALTRPHWFEQALNSRTFDRIPSNNFRFLCQCQPYWIFSQQASVDLLNLFFIVVEYIFAISTSFNLPGEILHYSLSSKQLFQMLPANAECLKYL